MGVVDGKVAVVTGGAQGIGEASARKFAEEGARVVIGDLNGPAAEAVAASIRAGGSEAVAVEVDISVEDQVVALMETAVTSFGRLDVLHNNAAWLATEEDGLVEDMPVDLWDRAFAVNARGTMLCCKHAIPRMLAGGGGSIVNMHSVDGLMGGDFARTAYGASKSALTAFTRSVATQYGFKGIRCNAVAPGLTYSEDRRARLGPAALERIERHFLVPTAYPPQQAAVVVFLASDAASFITGEVIRVDGGLLAHFPWYAEHFAPPQAGEWTWTPGSR